MTVTWPKIEIFKIQDGGGRHLKNRFFGHNSSNDSPISVKFCMRKQNGMSTRDAWQKLQIFKIQNGGRPPFWKSLNRHYLGQKSSDFDEIWYTTSDIESDYSQVTKNWNFRNSRWRRPPSWKSLFWPQFVDRLSDFSEILYEEAERYVGEGYMTKTANFYNPKWQTAAILKSLNRHISVKNRPILMKFGTLHQILNPIIVTWAKIEIFKIQDGGGRHPKNRFFGHNSSTDCPISAKFCTRKQNGMSTRVHDKNCKFLKSKMADGRHFENR